MRSLFLVAVLVALNKMAVAVAVLVELKNLHQLR
jgi:hypothetical protein